MNVVLFRRTVSRLARKRWQQYNSKACLSADSNENRKGLVLGVYSSKDKNIRLSPVAEEFNQFTQGKLLEHINLTGKLKAGKTHVFWGIDKQYPAVAVVALKDYCNAEEQEELINHQKENIRVAVAAGCKALDSAGIKNIFVENFSDPKSSGESATLSAWKFQEYKSKKDALPTVSLYGSNDVHANCWNQGVCVAEAQNVARRLADTPANLMTPTIFAEQAESLLRPLGVDVKVYDRKWAENQKMGAFLAVSKGSKEEPKFLELTYSKKEGAPFCLVGKGVTFDAGGYSLKPAPNMGDMRADMSGAACVVGTLYGIAKLNIETNIKALIPLCENLINGKAVKPGDVIFARNGKSICVDNTDAEGRLILADALSYSAEFKPQWVLDLATLTGAMMVALGNGATGVFSNSSKLYQSLELAGSETGDRVWRMPLWSHYTQQISKNAAYDLNNIGKGKGGGSCTAAAFLKEFVPEKTDWMHLDIAGVCGPDETQPYLGKGMTGRPTRTLIQFIQNQVISK